MQKLAAITAALTLSGAAGALAAPAAPSATPPIAHAAKRGHKSCRQGSLRKHNVCGRLASKTPKHKKHSLLSKQGAAAQRGANATTSAVGQPHGAPGSAQQGSAGAGAQQPSASQPALTPQQSSAPQQSAAPQDSSTPPQSSSQQPADSQAPAPAGLPSGSSSAFVKGVNSNMQGWGVPAVPQIAGEIHSLGATWAREDLAWSQIEPAPGVFNWSSFDAVVAAAKAQNLTILPVIGYAPSWTTPEDASGYAAFVAAAVKRYGPGTSANLPWFELWNEPNLPYAWSGKQAEPAAYAKDVRAAAQAAKAAAPSVKVLMMGDYQDSPQTGGSTPWQVSMIDDYFAAVPDLGQWIDGIAVHPYGGDPTLPLVDPAGVSDNSGGWKDATGNWAFKRIDSIRAKFLAHGVNLPFWMTEQGWTTYSVSEQTQADYYKKLFPEIASRPWIRALFPYDLREVTPNPTDDQSQYGLERFGSWQPKPAFSAVQSGFASLS